MCTVHISLSVHTEPVTLLDKWIKNPHSLQIFVEVTVTMQSGERDTVVYSCVPHHNELQLSVGLSRLLSQIKRNGMERSNKVVQERGKWTLGVIGNSE